MKWHRGIFSWFCPVYTVSYVLLRCDVAEIPALLAGEIPDLEVRRSLTEMLDIPRDSISGRFVGMCSEAYGTVVAIWLRPRVAGVPVLAHEILHAVQYVLDGKGLSLSDQTDEAYTYYLEFLLREAMTRLAGSREQYDADVPVSDRAARLDVSARGVDAAAATDGRDVSVPR